MNARLSRSKRWLALALLILIPLAITGLVTSVLGGAGTRTDQVPALIVNNDQMVTTTATDGTQSQVLAGRLLVTALTGDDSPGFKWSLANDASAEADLKAGKAYAVVTIPSDFSKSITSLSTSSPVQANITMSTDDAHSYLAGSLAQALGTAMTSTLGQNITQQYLSGLYSQLGTFGTSMSSAASGASGIANGAVQLHDGLVTISTGISSAASGASDAASGASTYANGVSQYTKGVDSLSSGLGQLSNSTTPISQGLSAYCTPTQTLSACSVSASMTVAQLSGILSGVQSSATGAAQLSAGSAALRDGGTSLANGLSSLSGGLEQLADGTSQSASGAESLASGASQLASGLQQGADKFASSSANPDATAKVVSQPVTLTSNVLNPLDSLRDLVALLILPAALWLGALGIFVARRPFSHEELQSTAGSLRVVTRSVLRAMLFALLQVAVALIVAVFVGVSPAALGLGALLALAASFAFVCLHLLFKLWWPRAANLVSMMLLIVQIIALPGVLPSQMLPDWMQTLSQLLPLTWAMNGMQAIVAGTGYSTAVGAGVGLLALGVVAALITTMVLSRRRITAAWGFAVAPLS